MQGTGKGLPEPENFYLCPVQNSSDMVKHVSIQNFKSIKNLEFEARRVNIFIGEPNTGKSNILEALGLFSIGTGKPKEFVRFKDLNNLYYDNDISQEVKIEIDSSSIELSKEFSKKTLVYWSNEEKKDISIFNKYHDTHVKLYKFMVLSSFPGEEIESLNSPYGKNLFMVLLTNKKLKTSVSDFLNARGFKLSLETKGNKISIAKEIDNIIYPTSYQSISDTLQRIIFYLAAIESNKDAVLLFEEPEANTFPYYTKQLAERIAADESNQYFLVTHNPYFLNSLVQQTRIEELNVFVTYMENYQTKVRRLSENDFSKILDLDKEVFYNLDTLGQNA